MNVLRVVIVDDEPLGRRGIRQLLRPHADIQIAGEAKNGREAVRLVRKLEPDVVFLDVQMPETDGFEVLRQLDAHRMPWVIFVTAYDSFAVRAFEAHALDYLVKPVHEDRFEDAMSRVRAKLHSDEAVRLTDRLTALLAARNAEFVQKEKVASRLIIPGPRGEIVLDADEIDWIEANDYYAVIHARGSRTLTRASLDVLETRLSRVTFIRVHRSAIVNLSRVSEIRIGTHRAAVLLKDGTRVPLSRRRRKTVTSAVRRFSG